MGSIALMAVSPPADLRKDALRNRQRLLDAAAELFAQQGLGVTLNDIAHHAGLGVGTAYRRFANKDELIDALFEDRFQDVATLAAAALDDDDPWRGLVGFLEGSLRLLFNDRGLVELVTNTPVRHENVMRMRTEIAPMINAIVERAKAHGQLRPDVTGTDLAFMGIGLAAVMDTTRPVSQDLYLRLLDVFLDGLCTDRTELSTLRGAPLGIDETHAITTSP